jgi:hypothetical protein
VYSKPVHPGDVQSSRESIMATQSCERLIMSTLVLDVSCLSTAWVIPISGTAFGISSSVSWNERMWHPPLADVA